MGDEAERLRHDEPQRVVAEVTITGSGQQGVLYDALGLHEFDAALLEIIAQRRRLKGRGGNVVAWRGPLLRGPAGDGDSGIGKRAAEDQAAAHLGPVRRAAGIETVPPAALGHQSRAGTGAFPYRAVVLSMLRRWREHWNITGPMGSGSRWRRFTAGCPKAESGWEYTLQALDRYYERVLSLPAGDTKFPPVDKPLIQLVRQEFPAEVPELVGTYLESARLLGLRTAELHLALAARREEPGVRP